MTAVEQLLAEVVDALGAAGAGLRAELTPDPVRAAEIVDALVDVAADAAGRRIESAVINDRRVDATVVSAGREWRLACSIDGDGVHSAASFERPAPFEGVPGGRAVVIVGPSSAGKSTVMRAVVDASTTPWVLFDELSFGDVALPFLIWPERSPTLRAGFVAGIAALAAAGNQVILSSGGNSPDVLRPITDAVPTLVVGLDCPLEVRIARQRARTDRWGGLTESHDDTHGGWALGARFDTSVVSAEEIAMEILEAVR